MNQRIAALIAGLAALAIVGVVVIVVATNGSSSSSTPQETVAANAAPVQTQTQTVTTVTTTASAPQPKPHKPKPAAQTTTTVVQQPATTTTVEVPPSSAPCNPALTISAATSCGFANSVFQQYSVDVTEDGAGNYDVYAHSDATGLDYIDVCDLSADGSTVYCSHGNGESISFPSSAA